jgi:hypothetical protein
MAVARGAKRALAAIARHDSAEAEKIVTILKQRTLLYFILGEFLENDAVIPGRQRFRDRGKKRRQPGFFFDETKQDLLVVVRRLDRIDRRKPARVKHEFPVVNRSRERLAPFGDSGSVLFFVFRQRQDELFYARIPNSLPGFRAQPAAGGQYLA